MVVLPQICNITEAYVDDIANQLNHFRKEEDYCRLKYSKSGIKDGIFDVYLQDKPDDDYKHFIRISAIKISVSKYKSLIIPNPGIMLVDEFIPNVRIGEK